MRMQNALAVAQRFTMHKADEASAITADPKSANTAVITTDDFIVSGAEKYLHLRDRKIMQPIPVKTILSTLLDSEELKAVWDKEIAPAKGGEPAVTFGSALREAMEDEEAQSLMSTEIGADISLGQVLDALQKAIEMDKETYLRLKKDEIVPLLEERIAARYHFQEAGIRVRLRYDEELKDALTRPLIAL